MARGIKRGYRVTDGVNTEYCLSWDQALRCIADWYMIDWSDERLNKAVKMLGQIDVRRVDEGDIDELNRRIRVYEDELGELVGGNTASEFISPLRVELDDEDWREY